MSNTAWRRHGDVVRAITYADWLMIRPGTPGGDIFEARGWYEDELAQRAEGWRIHRRTASLMHCAGNVAVMLESPDDVFPMKCSSLIARAAEERLRFLEGLR